MRLRWAACGLIGCISAALALAAPEDDYARGMQAYARGDVVGAMMALRPAADAGHGPSQSLLGLMLERSGSVAEAIELYRSAAQRGDPEGMAALASLYVEGRGIAKDEKEAMRHFSKAADLGHRASIATVASAYIRDSAAVAGMPPEAAVAAVRRAADLGNLDAIEALESAYAKGRWNLPADPQQAAVWKAKAVARRAELLRAAAASAPKARP